MALTKLGKYLALSDLRNSDGKLGSESVVGLSTQKQIISTKASLDGVSLTSYKLFPPKHYAYVPDTSRRGDKMSLGYNTTKNTFLVSSISVVFFVSDTDNLLEDYLYMYFNRTEFDRYARFNSWGSAREAFSLEDMCDIDIDLPPLPVQRKYVDIYNAMLANQRAYENGLEDLNAAISASVEEFKHTAPRVAVGTLLEEIDTRNRDGIITNVQGINITKDFMPSVANLSSTDLAKYKVITKDQFAYSPMQTGRDECIRIALFHGEEPVIISPAYSVLQVKSGAALAEYIMLWFSRKESDRYGWFISDSSVRASLELSRFYEIEIPLPSLDVQQYLVNIYTVLQLRREINEQLKAQIKDLCPILIKGSLEEAAV